MTEEHAVRLQMLEILQRCVDGAASLSDYIHFEADYLDNNTFSDAFLGHLGGLSLLAHEYYLELRGPEDFLQEARAVLDAAQQAPVPR